MTSCFVSCKPGPFCKRIYPKRKEFATVGSKFFHFRVDPFQEGGKNIDGVASPESVSISLQPGRQNQILCSVDPDEIAHNEQSHQDLLFVILFLILD